MYLIPIDQRTGLIDERPSNSSWQAIAEFNKLASVSRFGGVRAMTVVALTVDYFSIYASYPEKDRFRKACEEIYGDKDYLDPAHEYIKEAMDKYSLLQFDADLEQRKINNEIKLRLLNKIKVANENEDDAEIDRLRKSLAMQDKAESEFNKNFDMEKAIGRAVTNSGYELSRIERELKFRKNSKFNNFGENLENPNRLGLTDKRIKNGKEKE